MTNGEGDGRDKEGCFDRFLFEKVEKGCGVIPRTIVKCADEKNCQWRLESWRWGRE
jgi:hypothetical protein